MRKASLQLNRFSPQNSAQLKPRAADTSPAFELSDYSFNSIIHRCMWRDKFEQVEAAAREDGPRIAVRSA